MGKISKKTIIVSVLVALSLVTLLGLAFLAQGNKYFSWDLAVTRWVQSHRSGFLDTFFSDVSWPGFPPQGNYITTAIILFFIVKKWFKEALAEFAAAVLEVVVGYGFKFWVNRPRPPADLIHVVHRGLEGGKFSFPAGHVESYVAIFGFLAIVLFLKMRATVWRKMIITLLILLIVLVGPSRVYMGEHWTSDVIGAYLVGTVVLGAVYIGYNWMANAKKNN